MTEQHSPAREGSRDPRRNACVYRVLRYAPNLVRDEWANIGILLFNPVTGERRLRLIEDQEEFRRVRRLHPEADEAVLRAMRDDLEDRFRSAGSEGPSNAVPGRPLASEEKGDVVHDSASANGAGQNRANPSQTNGSGAIAWLELLAKWDDTLSNALQLAPQKAVLGADLDAEMERLYADHVAVPSAVSRVGAPGSRARVRAYCSQVFRQARLWEHLEKSVRAEQWTLPGDPQRIDYSYRRNGTRGFVQTLSVTRAPLEFKQLAYTAEHIRLKEKLQTEFTVVTDVPLVRGQKRDDFLALAFRDAQIQPVPMEGFAVWVAKLKPLLLQ